MPVPLSEPPTSFDAQDEILQTQALLVTAGPFEGRICENDDDDIVLREELRADELEWIDAAGAKWRNLERGPGDDDGEELEGVDCEVVTFGRYLLCRGYHLIPRQFLRPASMRDLIQRHKEIQEALAGAALRREVDMSSDELYHLLLEDSFITDEIWGREKLVENATGDKVVFLCHSSTDKPFVRQVRNDLAQAGHKPWIDEFEIMVGDSIVAKINEASASADAVVLFISKAAMESSWVSREWQSALSRNLSGFGGRILPVLIEDCALPPLLSDIKYADFRESYNNGLAALLAAIE